MKKRIYEIIEAGSNNDKIGIVYDIVMFVSIILSMIPLTTKSTAPVFIWIDRITVVIFIIDYILRLFTADLKLKQGKISFFKYPFTFMALIDLLSILPSLIPINSGLKILKLLRVGRTLKVFKALKVFKVFKTFRYSKNIQIIIEVFKRQKNSLIVVCGLALMYILVSALIVFNVEPDTFNTFFDAIYWAVISLTTVGYGDVFCVSKIGRIVTMISSVFGIAIVALPAGIITAGYMEEIQKQTEDSEDNK